MKLFNRSRQRGAALLMVISAMIVLTLMIAGLWEVAQYSWDDSGRDRYLFQARQLAESGAAIAQHPSVEKGDPVLIKDYGDGRSYEVKITSEGSRIRLNAIGDERLSQTAIELFILWGLDETQASTAVESMIDWIDTGDDARSNGAEQPYYASLKHPEFPLNEDFVSLEQLLLVRGFDAVARAKPNWRDYFTLYGDGMIDVNTAPADLLEAFLQITTDSALSFVQTRAGADGIPDTSDDYRVETEDEAQNLLGMTSDDWNNAIDWVSLENTTKRIESIGRVGDVAVRLIVLATSGGEDSPDQVVARLQQ